MTNVLIDRKLLERLQERLDPHRDAVDWGLVCDAFRVNPAQQSEAVEVVGWLGGNGLHADRHDATGAPFPLMTVAQHQRILAASVPACCKAVPVELLERLEHVTRTLVPHLQCHVDLRALLASAGQEVGK